MIASPLPRVGAFLRILTPSKSKSVPGDRTVYANSTSLPCTDSNRACLSLPPRKKVSVGEPATRTVEVNCTENRIVSPTW